MRQRAVSQRSQLGNVIGSQSFQERGRPDYDGVVLPVLPGRSVYDTPFTPSGDRCTPTSHLDAVEAVFGALGGLERAVWREPTPATGGGHGFRSHRPSHPSWINPADERTRRSSDGHVPHTSTLFRSPAC